MMLRIEKNIIWIETDRSVVYSTRAIDTEPFSTTPGLYIDASIGFYGMSLLYVLFPICSIGLSTFPTYVINIVRKRHMSITGQKPVCSDC